MKRLLPIVGLLVLVFLVYANSLHGEFVFDDAVVVLTTKLLAVHTLSDALRPNDSVRGLLATTYRLNYWAGGIDPFGYHLVNVSLHALNVLIIYAILMFLCGDQRYSFFGAAVFGVHTLFSGAVDYVSGRSSILCGTFYLFSIYFCVRALRSMRVRWPWVILSAISAYLAWQTKQEAITLPIILAFIVLWHTEFRYWRIAVALSCIPAAIAVMLREQFVKMYADTAISTPLLKAGFEQALPFGAYLRSYLVAVCGYLLPRFVVPFGLSADPQIPTVAHFYSPEFLFSVLMLAAMAYGAWFHREENPLLTLGIAALLISPLLAYAGVPVADIIQEHRAYIPGLGIAILACWLVQWTDEHMRLRWAMIVPVLAILSAMTVQRADVWATNVSFWQDAARKAPEKARTQFDLGEAYQRTGNLDAAMQQYAITLKLKPDLYAAYSNVGAISLDLGAREAMAKHFDRALNYFRMAETNLQKVIRESPDFPEARINLGVLYLRTSRASQAAEMFAAVVAIDPDNYAAHFNLGQANEMLGKRELAIVEYQTAVRLRPDVPEIRPALERLTKGIVK